jgi:hypothetical protein
MSAIQYIKTKHAKWKYVLTADYECSVRGFYATRPRYFYCGSQLLGFLIGNHLTIKSGYASDGATCAPDFDCMMAEVFVHDLGCQFCNVEESPFSRSQIDSLFYFQLQRSRHRTARLLALIYYKGVRIGAKYMQTKPDANLTIEIK